MGLTPKKRKVAAAIATEPRPVVEILKEHGVPKSTYYSRWVKDPDFLELLHDLIADFEAEVRHVAFASKRRRIEERQRLYDETPMEGNEYWPEGQVRRVWLNVDVKEKILNDIEREMEGQRVALGPVGSKDQLDLIERRRKAAADLEAFEAGLTDDAV